MRTTTVSRTARALAALGALSGAAAQAAVTAAPGYAVRTIPTAAQVQGGVVRHGDDLYVGQGPTFSAGNQRVVRFREGGPATTIAIGFNSLGGFHLAPGSGTLFVVDNGLEATGATSGDTAYAIPEAATRATALSAALAELLPTGSIDNPNDVLAAPGAILVTDATGPGAGRVVDVTGGVVTPLIAGLDYAAGLALDGGTLLVGNSDASFVGSVRRYDLTGASQGTLVDGLSGNYSHAVDDAGVVLVSGGFTGDFSSSTVVAVDALGGVTERARGFAFSTELFFDPVRDETLVLDVGVSQVTAICRDRDGDAVCDADEPCGVPASRSTVTVKRLGAPLGDETFGFSGEVVLPSPLNPALDPSVRGLRIRVATSGGAAVVATVPPGDFDRTGKIGWRSNGAGTTWRFTATSGVGALGIRKATVKTSAKAPGLVKFRVKGTGAALAFGPGDLPLAATVQLDAAGQCAIDDFGDANSGCELNASQTGLRCR